MWNAANVNYGSERDFAHIDHSILCDGGARCRRILLRCCRGCGESRWCQGGSRSGDDFLVQDLFQRYVHGTAPSHLSVLYLPFTLRSVLLLLREKCHELVFLFTTRYYAHELVQPTKYSMNFLTREA